MRALRMGKMIALKPLVDESIQLAQAKPAHVILVDRGLDKSMNRVAGRDVDYAPEREKHAGEKVPIVWLESNEPSYILYTSGTTGKPKGVLRDTGGYAVRAQRPSMKHIFCSKPGRGLLLDLGHRLGRGPLVHRLWAAHQRLDHHHVRGRADAARRGRAGGRSVQDY
jgi:propionyl-CoA synthetase